ncbi:MAG: DNA repair exonuclease [Chloroflexi bacterium]|nr:DNA repair exonuclease [Chloroflexota bacterium]
MQPFKFVHAADLHIDSPVVGLKSRNDVVGRRVQEAGYEALDNLIKLCLAEEVDFLLVAGDVYDGAIRSPRAQLRFRDALAELADAGIQSFVVHGNHDPLNGRFSSITYPKEAHIFGAEPEWAEATRNDEAIARVQGVSYPQREVTENLVTRFSEPPDGDLFSIGLLHCNLGGDPAHPNYAPCTVDDLKAKQHNYWALGHIHKTGVPYRDQFTTIVYPGNIQARDAGEPGARGCYVVEVDGAGVVDLEFRALDAVRWDVREVSIEGLAGIDDLRDEVMNTLEAALLAGDGRDVVCRLTLTGRGPVHGDLADPVAKEEFVALLQADLPMIAPWVWLERLTDETKPDIDLEDRARQDDFLGEVLRRADAVEPGEFRTSLAEVFGRRDRRPELSDDEIASLVEEARWYLADLLEPDEPADPVA